MPEQPTEPRETKYVPAVSEAEEDALMIQFCKDRASEFVDFVNAYDGCILVDFIESIRWEWNQYKREAFGDVG